MRLFYNFIFSKFNSLLVGLLFVAGFQSVTAQVSLQYPTNRAVFQRNLANQGSIPVVGSFSRPVDRIEARLVSLQGAGTTAWTTIATNQSNHTFSGTITANGGWYTLQVRGILGEAFVAQSTLDRVGVGEVLMVAGQSNSTGVVQSSIRGATDDRVNTVNYYNANSSTGTPPEAVYSQLSSNTNIALRGENAWCWGQLGDMLAAKLNVPIMFFGAGWGATSSQNWRESSQGVKTKSIYTGQFFPQGMPYQNLNLLFSFYGKQLGYRSLLWTQGEADAQLINSNTEAITYLSKDTYISNIKDVISKTRSDAGANMAWVISRTSLTNYDKIAPDIIDAQNRVIATVVNCYAGPETDRIQVPRPDGAHFEGSGLTELANAWNNTLTPQFFNSVAPQIGSYQPAAISPSNYNATPFTQPFPVYQSAANGTADLSVFMGVDTETPAQNAEVSFTVSVANMGPDVATNIEIKDVLPAGLEFVSSQNFTNVGGILTAKIARIAVNNIANIRFKAKVTGTGTITNKVQITAVEQIDPNSTPNNGTDNGENDASAVTLAVVGVTTSNPTTPVTTTPTTPVTTTPTTPVTTTPTTPVTTTPTTPVTTTPVTPTPTTPVTTTPTTPSTGGGTADLALRVTPQIYGTIVRFQIEIRNDGPNDISSATMAYRVPSGASIMTTNSTNISFSGGLVIYSTPNGLKNGASESFFIQIRLQTSAQTIHDFEIISSSLPDPNSTPNNGADKGENDGVSITLGSGSSRLTTTENTEMDMEVSAYPNPVSTSLHVVVRLQTPDSVNLQLFDNQGNSYGVWSRDEALTKHEFEIAMEQIPKGVYLVQAQSSDKKLTKRVVKE